MFLKDVLCKIGIGGTMAFSGFPCEGQVLKVDPPVDFSKTAEVAVVLPFAQDEVLLLKRSAAHAQGNLWCAPGGKVHDGETPVLAAVRELKEETGVEVDARTLAHVGRFYVQYPNGDFIFHLFSTRLASEKQDVAINTDEHQSYCFCNLKDIHSLPLTPGLDECIYLATQDPIPNKDSCGGSMKSMAIQKALQQADESFFSPHNIRLKLLKNCPEAIPQLAQWTYDQWSSYDSSLTKEMLIESFNKRLNDDRIPFALVALRDRKPIGLVSLNENTAPEFSDYTDKNPWLGSLLVLPEEKKGGLEEELLKTVSNIARGLGYRKIYFYLSDPHMPEWYLKRGARHVEKRPFRGHTVSVMEISLE